MSVYDYIAHDEQAGVPLDCLQDVLSEGRALIEHGYDMTIDRREALDIDGALQEACTLFGCTREDISGPSREKAVVAARRRVAELLWDSEFKLQDIGDVIGRSHAAVHYLLHGKRPGGPQRQRQQTQQHRVRESELKLLEQRQVGADGGHGVRSVCADNGAVKSADSTRTSTGHGARKESS